MKLLLPKIWGWAFKSSLYLEKKVMANMRFTSSYIWRPCCFSIFGGRWEYFTILFEIRTDETVGIDTKTKSAMSTRVCLRLRHVCVVASAATELVVVTPIPGQSMFPFSLCMGRGLSRLSVDTYLNNNSRTFIIVSSQNRWLSIR